MGIIDFVFPKTCLECKKEGRYICEECIGKMKILSPACPYCEKPSIDGFTHTKCMVKNGLDGLTSIWDYDGVVKKAVGFLKYRYATEAGRELQNYFLIELKKVLVPDVFCLVPIPMYWHKENVRGFNQSVEIGKVVAGEMGWNFRPDILIKKKSTSAQVKLSVEDRKRNLLGVFSVLPEIPYSLPDILLFDDVFTTGSTLKEAAKALKKAGVKKVWGLTIAR